MDNHELLQALGRIEAGLEGVNGRLDTLNSKVAAHERRLNENDVAAAERRGRDSANKNWLGNLSPVAKVIGSLLALEALRNGPTLIKMLGH